MKRIIGVLMVVVAVAMAVPAQAQIKFGVKGGLNLAKADFDKSNVETGNFTGFFIGPMVEATIPIVGLGADASLLFSQKGLKVGSQTEKENGIEVPVNLKYSIGLGSLASVYLAAGPSFFFNLKSEDDLTLDKVKGKLNYESTEIALNLGAGVKVLKHLQVGVNYSLPFTDSAKVNITEKDLAGGAWDTFNGKTFKTKVWQVSVAYIF